MIFKYLLILLAIIFYLETQAQRKEYQLDSIVYSVRYPDNNRTEKKEYKYLENDSLKEIIYYYLDTILNKFVPNISYRYYDINPHLYYYSVYYWDINESKFKYSDSFKESKTIHPSINLDSSFVLNNGSWKLNTIRTSWHNSDFYPTQKNYDSVKSKNINSNTYIYNIQWKFDQYGRDTLSWERRTQGNLDIIYKKVYDDSNRLSELYYAHYLNKYYLKEKLNYDDKGNIGKIVFTKIPSSGPTIVDSFTYFQYHNEIKLKNCNFRYYNEYYGQPFNNVPISETLPWDTTGAHFEKREFYYSRTKAYSGLGKTVNSLISLYPNPSKGRIRHTSLEPLRLYFYTIDGRKIEETRLEANEDYQLRNYSQNMVIVEAYNLKGEKQFSEKLVLE